MYGYHQSQPFGRPILWLPTQRESHCVVFNPLGDPSGVSEPPTQPPPQWKSHCVLLNSTEDQTCHSQSLKKAHYVDLTLQETHHMLLNPMVCPSCASQPCQRTTSSQPYRTPTICFPTPRDTHCAFHNPTEDPTSTSQTHGQPNL